MVSLSSILKAHHPLCLTAVCPFGYFLMSFTLLTKAFPFLSPSSVNPLFPWGSLELVKTTLFLDKLFSNVLLAVIETGWDSAVAIPQVPQRCIEYTVLGPCSLVPLSQSWRGNILGEIDCFPFPLRPPPPRLYSIHMQAVIHSKSFAFLLVLLPLKKSE